jgi:hypothetical protein
VKEIRRCASKHARTRTFSLSLSPLPLSCHFSSFTETISHFASYFLSCYTILQVLLTYCVEQSPASEANRSSATQEIQRILWNLDVHCLIHNNPPLSLLWATWIQSTPNPSSWRSIMIVLIHAYVFRLVSFPQISPRNSCWHVSCLHTCHIPSTSHSYFASILNGVNYINRVYIFLDIQDLSYKISYCCITVS